MCLEHLIQTAVEEHVDIDEVMESTIYNWLDENIDWSEVEETVSEKIEDELNAHESKIRDMVSEHIMDCLVIDLF